MGTSEKSVQSDEAVAAAQWAEWRSSRRRLLKMGAFAGGLAAAGAMGSVGPFARGAAAQGTPKVGGTVTMSLADADVASLDPIAIFDNMSIWTQLLIYDQLLRPAADGTSVEPSLAEKWEKSADGLTYTFHLRDATFHDGSPVTAEDAAFSIDRAAHDPASQNGFIFSAIASLTATDPKTLTIKLKNPWAPLEADLALYGASILPKKLVTAQGAEFFSKPVGSGAFAFVSWERDVQIKLKKNAAYWETGKPYLDGVTLKVLTDSNARMLEFQGGGLDIATLVPYSQLEGLRGNPAVTVVPDAVARIDYCAMNLLRKPFDDKLLRQAVNYAVDKDAIIKTVLFGNGAAANTYLPRMAYHDDAAPGYPFNLQKAKDLVAQSTAKDGFKAELLINAGDAVAAQVAQLIAANLSAIGGKITITSLDPATVTERYTKALDYDMTISYYTTDIIDPDELTTFAVLSDSGAKAVWTSYKNDAVDAKIKAAQVETDAEKRKQMYSEIQRTVADDAHQLLLYYPSGSTATQKAVQNFHILPTGNYRLWETWVE